MLTRHVHRCGDQWHVDTRRRRVCLTLRSDAGNDPDWVTLPRPATCTNWATSIQSDGSRMLLPKYARRKRHASGCSAANARIQLAGCHPNVEFTPCVPTTRAEKSTIGGPHACNTQRNIQGQWSVHTRWQGDPGSATVDTLQACWSSYSTHTIFRVAYDKGQARKEAMSGRVEGHQVRAHTTTTRTVRV